MLSMGRSVSDTFNMLAPGLMKDHGQQARASENFAGPVTRASESLKMYWQIWPWCLKIYRPSKIFTGPGLLAVVFHKPWLQWRKQLNKAISMMRGNSPLSELNLEKIKSNNSLVFEDNLEREIISLIIIIINYGDLSYYLSYCPRFKDTFHIPIIHFPQIVIDFTIRQTLSERPYQFYSYFFYLLHKSKTYCILNCWCNRDVRFGHKFGHIGIKWDESGTF